MGRKKSITKRRRLLFIEKLRTTGSIVKSAIEGQIGRSSWYDLRARDTDFKNLWDDSEAEFMDNVEAEALKRAVFGVPRATPYLHVTPGGEGKPDIKETMFHTITIKSDRLLELCLTRRHPLYKTKTALELTSPDGSMTPPAADIDTDNLSDKELRALVLLQRKLRGRSGDSE